MCRFFVFAICMGCISAAAEMRVENDGQAVHILEDDAPVLVYHHAMVEPPKMVPERYTRACYIHPVYAPGGATLTQDFPIDHFHHRGVFWAWPKSTWDGKPLDIWLMEDVRQETKEVKTAEAAGGKAVLETINFWRYDDAPDQPIVEERVHIEAHPAEDNARAIDFDLTFENVSDKEVVIRGSTAEDKSGVIKGYGGFCFRPDATRKPMEFTAKQGPAHEDTLSLESPWCDVSFPDEKDGEAKSGAAVFQHPGNPGYPHEGWILRHYGFLGASWPHRAPHTMAPGDSFRLRYRLYVHDGDAAAADVTEAFADYTAAAKKAMQ
ncbi:MAG: PmoA family protein [Candidatus Hydrogenedentota bacterium]